jgi:hypothetical protein
MPMLTIHVNGEGCWPDLPVAVGQDGPRWQQTEDLSIAALAHGMQSGKTSVMIRMNLPDGSVALGETSLALLLAAARAFEAVYGDQT